MLGSVPDLDQGTTPHVKSGLILGFVILEELDDTYHLTGLQVPPHVTSSDEDTYRTEPLSVDPT
ncbi:Hypothetical protein SMAX5B_000884 [Scophthalmus maximus]|uniref:Uncharacterized protein n=1 Tax=Scophthalmus maximus TaxID=52904 RepID=A0A2U9C6Q2_SCOMX|nr:Hypothetical protein SMAX5B_000884 [Scophthalmus maximus]